MRSLIVLPRGKNDGPRFLKTIYCGQKWSLFCILIITLFFIFHLQIVRIMSEINSDTSLFCKATRVVNGSAIDLSSKNVKLVHFVRHAQV